MRDSPIYRHHTRTTTATATTTGKGVHRIQSEHSFHRQIHRRPSWSKIWIAISGKCDSWIPQRRWNASRQVISCLDLHIVTGGGEFPTSHSTQPYATASNALPEARIFKHVTLHYDFTPLNSVGTMWHYTKVILPINNGRDKRKT